MRAGAIIGGVLALAVVLGATGTLLVAVLWPPAIALAPPGQAAFDAARIVRGAQLASIGNCNVCHTRRDGRPYAGGRPIATPFGTVYSSNITPDPETGIGGWSEAAFVRAMREGVSRDGHHLYPAFPYDHMTKMRDADIRAVYAFVMTRRPMRGSMPPNALAFPFNHRPLVAVWKLLFLDRGALKQDPGRGAEWNEGAYLVEGLGHCGACHTPRNALGAERTKEAFAGGSSDGWVAPALDAASPTPVPWDAEGLYRYLRGNAQSLHGVAAGPMAPVASNLADVPDADLRAIATYAASLAGIPRHERQVDAERALAQGRGSAGSRDETSDGAAIYAGACAQCHGGAGREPLIPALDLALSSVLRLPRPDNALHILRQGIAPVDDAAGPFMPPFAGVLTGAQTIALLDYVRSHFAGRPSWAGLAQAVRAGQKDRIEANGRIGNARRQP